MDSFFYYCNFILQSAGNKIWYFVQKGSNEDYYVCTLNGNEKKDVHYTRKKKILRSEAASSGKTMELILSEIATGQKKNEESCRKLVTVDVNGYPCSHYSFAFGERTYKIADEFGITIEYSNLTDEAAGFRLRNIIIGSGVKFPEEV